ncbi:YcxB family protein [Massilia sp. Dwa41.01b]|uniref:hypothetical protein n=1 Tax=unclassified Massilia TaxID=2609279 RepID=UPI00160016ED|nr:MULTISPECIES: hypothetical protein [unclassified Massilia]QNA90466.1 YcxB family protein [Massilia sp. Dwa41.01b]QNA97697.1 YcxB family protein [Massilia sp. Se16.2.3]
MTSTTFSTGRPLTVRLRSHTIAAWACIAIFLGCSVAAFLAGQYGPSAFFWVFIALGAYILVSSGSFELDEDGIGHRNTMGRYRMLWRDVERVDIGVQGTLVLYGDDMRFVVAPVSAWSGQDRDAAFALLRRKMEERGLEPRTSHFGDYKAHRNVKR